MKPDINLKARDITLTLPVCVGAGPDGQPQMSVRNLNFGIRTYQAVGLLALTKGLIASGALAATAGCPDGLRYLLEQIGQAALAGVLEPGDPLYRVAAATPPPGGPAPRPAGKKTSKE